MKSEIIAVGTELLTGDTLNTNAAYLTKQLSIMGFSVHYHTTIGDNPNRLEKLIKMAVERSDLIIITGGLGPTQDDLTKEVVAKALDMALEIDEAVLLKLKTFFAKREFPMTENNLKQALIPKGSRVLDNSSGTAPGIYINTDKKHIFMLPGPPGEMKAVFNNEVYPLLEKLTEGIVTSRYYGICGVGESLVETQLIDIINNQDNPTIATYAKLGEVLLRVTANGNSTEETKVILDIYEKKIKKVFFNNIFTDSQSSLVETVCKQLIKKGISIATAESCTGGLIAAKMTEMPGISSVFNMGLITYSNEVKTQLLKVNKHTLEQYGAVSKETAREMCENLYEISNSDIAISVTGIAGPGGGSSDKPIGLVYIGLKNKNETYVQENFFSGQRKIIQERVANKVFQIIFERILNKNG